MCHYGNDGSGSGLDADCPCNAFKPGNRVRFNITKSASNSAWKKSWKEGTIISYDDKRKGYMVRPDGRTRNVFVEYEEGGLRLYLRDFEIYIVVKKLHGQIIECLGANVDMDEAMRTAIVTIKDRPEHAQFEAELNVSLDKKYPKAYNYRVPLEERKSDEDNHVKEWLMLWSTRLVEFGYILTKSVIR